MTEDRREWDPYAPAPAVETLTGVVTPDEDVWPDLDEVEPPEQAGDPKAAAAEIPADLDDITKADLVALAELAGVATYGNKHDIAERIKAAAQ